jgi:ribosomal protein S21
VRPLKKTFTKIGLVEWLKVKALSSNPSTAKKKKKMKLLE